VGFEAARRAHEHEHDRDADYHDERVQHDAHTSWRS
jgi:hypothetical protein